MTLDKEVSIFFGELRSFLGTVLPGLVSRDYLDTLLNMCQYWKDIQKSRGYDISLIEEQLAYTILPYLKEQMQSWEIANVSNSCIPLFFDKMEGKLARNAALYPTGMTELHLIRYWIVGQIPSQEKHPFLYDLLRSADGLSFKGDPPVSYPSDLIASGFLQGTSYKNLALFGLSRDNDGLNDFLMFTQQYPAAVEQLESLALGGGGSISDVKSATLNLPALKTLNLSYMVLGNRTMSSLLQSPCMCQLEHLIVVGLDVGIEVYLEWGKSAQKTFDESGVTSPLKVLDFGFWKPLAVRDKRTKVWRDIRRVFNSEVFPLLEIR